VSNFNTDPKFLGASPLPKKTSGAKYMQNIARSQRTSKFGGKYLSKRIKIFEIGQVYDEPRVLQCSVKNLRWTLTR